MYLHSHVLEFGIRFFVLSVCVCGQWSEARRVEYECDRLSYCLNVVTPHSVHVPLPCCGSRDITAGQLHTCRPCPINELSFWGDSAPFPLACWFYPWLIPLLTCSPHQLGLCTWEAEAGTAWPCPAAWPPPTVTAPLLQGRRSRVWRREEFSMTGCLPQEADRPTLEHLSLGSDVSPLRWCCCPLFCQRQVVVPSV